MVFVNHNHVCPSCGAEVICKPVPGIYADAANAKPADTADASDTEHNDTPKEG